MCMYVCSRSVHRPQPVYTPHITAHWHHTPDNTYTLFNKHLTYWPIFTRCDYQHMMDNLLPDRAITYRYDATQYVNGSELKRQLNTCIDAIQRTHSRLSQFGRFTVLKDSDFNYKHHCGVLILKSNDHPFIVKLFMEKPHALTKPYSKGIEPCFFFSMTGGMSRFFAGFTRIKNKMSIANIVSESPRWHNWITLPRKWFWMPDDGTWITIHGHHVRGHGSHDAIDVPSTYAVISDAIETDHKRAMFTSANRKMALDITKDIGYNRLDPHIDNFVIEKYTNKIAIIDTEHFASITGIQEPMQFSNYTSWYLKLSRKCLKDIWLQSKRDRTSARTDRIAPTLIVEDTYG